MVEVESENPEENPEEAEEETPKRRGRPKKQTEQVETKQQNEQAEPQQQEQPKEKTKEERLLELLEKRERVEMMKEERERRLEEERRKKWEEGRKIHEMKVEQERDRSFMQRNTKKFSLPRYIQLKVGTSKFKNHVLIIFLRRNREVELKYMEILNDMIRIEDKYYDARVDCYYTYGKSRVPVLVIPEWSLRPIGTADYQRVVARGETTDLQDITIKAHERMEASGKKMKISPQAIVIFVLLGIVAIYLITSGGL